jgi:hypothetical protein
MPRGANENDPPSALGRRQHESALQLGPRKRAYADNFITITSSKLLTQNSARTRTFWFITAAILVERFMLCVGSIRFLPMAFYATWSMRTNPRSRSRKSKVYCHFVAYVFDHHPSDKTGSIRYTGSFLGSFPASRNVHLVDPKRRLYTLQI